MHDYISKSIKLHLVDPRDPSKRTRVLLSLTHLVRMEPEYYLEKEGKRTVVAVGADEDATRRERGVKRSFIIYDDMGSRYESSAGSREAQALLEQIWSESA